MSVLGVVIIIAIISNIILYPQLEKSITDKSHKNAITQFENDIENQKETETFPMKQRSVNHSDTSVNSAASVQSNNTSDSGISKVNNKGSVEKVAKKLTIKDLEEDVKKYNKKIYIEGQGKLNEESIKTEPLNLAKYGIKNNIYGYISIPDIKVRLPIYLGCTNNTMAKGAAHLSQTSIPYGGVNSHSVIAGHCGYGYSDYFRYLEKLKKGAEVIIITPFNKLSYCVVNKKIIKPKITEDLLIHTGKDMVTLFTCYPYPSNKQRCCVFCERKKKGL